MSDWLRIAKDELDIDSNSLDALFYSSILSNSASLRKVMPKRANKVIGGDIFQELFQWTPKLKTEPPDKAMAAWLEAHESDPAWVELRKRTVADKYLSAAGAVRLYRELMRKQASSFKTVNQMAEHKEQMQTLAGDSPQAQDAAQIIAQAQAAYGEAIKGESANEISQAVASTNESLEQAQDMAQFDNDAKGGGIGLGDDASERALQIMLDEKLLDKVSSSDQLRKILRLAGRMRVVLQAAKADKPKPAPPPVGVTVGNDLASVLPQELALLTDSELEPLFWRKYSEHGLLQYERKSKPHLGKGPLVFCIDVSGSMSGQPEVIAYALLTALGRMALRERRKLACIVWASEATNAMPITSSQDIINLVTHTYRVGGGTEVDKPLAKAIEYIDKEPKADIVVISDMYIYSNDASRKQYNIRKQELKFRTFGISIGAYTRPQHAKELFDSISVFNPRSTSLDWLEQLAPELV